MSRYSTNDLRDRFSLIGMVAEHGKAWTGAGHYSGAVPVDEAIKFLQADVAPMPVAWHDLSSAGRLTVDLLAELNFLVEADDEFISLTPELRARLAHEMGYVNMAKHRAIVNRGTKDVYQVASDGWAHHDYVQWLIEFVCSIVDASQGELLIGSVLNFDGKKACVQIRPPEGVTVGGDMILPWIAAYSSNDGSLATGYKACRTRIVCDNTMEASIREAGQALFKIKHTSGSTSEVKIMEVREAIGLIVSMSESTAKEIDELQNTSFSDSEFEKLCDVVLDAEAKKTKASNTIVAKKKGQLGHLWTHDIRVCPFKGTAWGATQAFNTFYAHYRSAKNVNGVLAKRQGLNLIEGKTGREDAFVLTCIDNILNPQPAPEAPELVAAA